jgi:hypothetical protein
MVGSCETGMDLMDAVQCTLSTTPIGSACAANEWLSSSLSADPVVPELPDFIPDTGTPLLASHVFRSDIHSNLSVFLTTTGTGQNRQSVVRVVYNGGKTLLHFVYPR